jgi:hypothetical protein
MKILEQKSSRIVGMVDQNPGHNAQDREIRSIETSPAEKR